MPGLALAVLVSTVVVGLGSFFMGYRLGYQDGSDNDQGSPA